MAAETPDAPRMTPQDVSRNKIIEAYQQYLKRTPSESEIQSHLNNPNGVDAALDVIKNAANTGAEPQSKTTSAYGTSVNLDRSYLEKQIRDAFAEKGNANPSQSEIDYWVQKSTTPDTYSDGKTRVGWNNYLKQRLITGSASADPSLAGDEGVIQNPAQYGLAGGSASPTAVGTFDLSSPLLRQYTGTMPTAPTATPMPTIPTAPAFQAPTQAPLPTQPGMPSPWAAFRAPTAEEAMQDPGYQFALREGQKAIQNAAAAKGTLNTGGTLRGLLNYGQQAAAQQYGNVYNRALQNYQTNYATQFQDPYNMQYNAWKDLYSNQAAQNQQAFQNALTGYNTNYQTQYANPYAAQLNAWQMGNQQAQNQYENAWNQYMQNYNQYRNWQGDVWNRASSYAGA